MRRLCKDRKYPDPVDSIRRDLLLLQATKGVASSDTNFLVLDKFLQELSEKMVSNEMSPKKR